MRLSGSWLSAGVKMRSDFCENDGVALVMPLDVSCFVAAVFGTITC